MFAVKTSNKTGYCRRASVLIQSALFGALVGVGLVALAIDTGAMFIARGEMQRVADSSALAGASGLLEGDSVATARATEYAGLNSVYQDAIAANELEVTIGNWKGLEREFYPETGSETVTPNAVRANGARTGLPLFFAPFIGIHTTAVTRGATAVMGAGVCAGIWGLEGITGNGTIYTNSYDSTAGPYGPGNIHPNGDICSCRDIGLSGTVDIYGDAIYGDGYHLDMNGSTNTVTGLVDDQTCEPIAPEFDMAAAALNNDNATIGETDDGHNPFQGATLRMRLVEDDNLTLAAGTYYFTSVTIVGQATLTVAGPTTMYLEDGASFGGGGITNLSHNPADLTIYSTGDIVLSGTADFYGAIIAPNSNIKLAGTDQFYGTMLGDTLTMIGTANIHVDETLVFTLFGISSVQPLLVD